MQDKYLTVFSDVTSLTCLISQSNFFVTSTTFFFVIFLMATLSPLYIPMVVKTLAGGKDSQLICDPRRIFGSNPKFYKFNFQSVAARCFFLSRVFIIYIYLHSYRTWLGADLSSTKTVFQLREAIPRVLHAKTCYSSRRTTRAETRRALFRYKLRRCKSVLSSMCKPDRSLRNHTLGYLAVVLLFLPANGSFYRT